MRILITGANGMVGKYLKKLIPEAITPNSKELDLTDSSNVINYFKHNKFDYVIHLTALVVYMIILKIQQTILITMF